MRDIIYTDTHSVKYQSSLKAVVSFFYFYLVVRVLRRVKLANSNKKNQQLSRTEGEYGLGEREPPTRRLATFQPLVRATFSF